MNIVKGILLLLFIPSIVAAMNMVPLQSKWHTLSPEMVYGFAHKLDFYTCDSLRLSCKDYRRIINHTYWKQKIKEMYSIAQCIDVDLYIKNMIFFATKSGRSDGFYNASLPQNRQETDAIRRLAYNLDEKLWNVGCQLYNPSYREILFKAYSGDFFGGKRGRSPYGELQIIQLIVHQTGNINFQNEEGNTLLHCAGGQMQYKYLLQQPDIDVDRRNNKGETPLHCAIANPVWIPYTGPLHIGGAGIDEWKLARALLEDGRADIKAVTNKGKTIFHYAARYASNRKKGFEYLETETTGFYILELLIERLKKDGLDNLLAVDNKGRTALYLAVKHGHPDAVERLFPFFSDEIKFSTDGNGQTLLHRAAMHKYSNSKVIKYLLAQFPAEMKYVRDSDGKTFLDYAYDPSHGLMYLIKNDDKYPVSSQDMDKFLTYSKKGYLNDVKKPLILGVLGYKKSLFLGFLAIIGAYFYIKTQQKNS